jgi:N utilization substance protein B
MGERRQARELALQALCCLDVDRGTPEELLELFCSNFKDRINEPVKPFFLELVNGVIESHQEINDLMNQSSSNWRVSRMPIVDRNIMRMAIFEMLKRPDIPSTVSINEAVEIGKRFGSRGSGAFINGVLDKVRALKQIDN